MAVSGGYAHVADYDGGLEIMQILGGAPPTPTPTATNSIPGGAGGVNSPDSRRLLASHNDGTLKIYAMNIEDLIALATTRLTRTWTTNECQTYLHMETCP